MDDIRIHLIIEGRVQGVWFRDSARRVAERLDLRGWVRNLSDGSVEIVAEGPETRVEEFVSWCHKGPPAAKVLKVNRNTEERQGEFDSFKILYTYGENKVHEKV